ncbi:MULTISPECIES: hypothetical protein [unclassified Bradyrhizobium]|uniref:hypothetical protein n=1 Tax=unclassified Bradyrhizobium TaxID=2631580 RepID=UPI0004209039|nr:MULTISPECIES: hypothetical protein [unclassified Bradyrhizobium]MCP3466466.1 hypothetical protein [Bradyrhizobium sp. CCGUVB23]
MSNSMFPRFAFAYGAAFALFYAIAHARGLALFTVYPAQGIVLLGLHRSRDVADPVLDFLAPEMYWYGWTASAAVGALVVGIVAALLPARLSPFWAWCAWVVPPMAMIACAYLTIPWFRL